MIINIAQVVVSVVLVVLIMIQQKGAALGSAFGGDSQGFYSSKRGAEKKIYYATIIFGIIFIALSLANLII